MNVLITTVPFGEIDDTPIKLLENAGIRFVINPYNRKLNSQEVEELIVDYDAVIAGTEVITKEAIFKSPKLKIISRVGVGLDGVNLAAAHKKNIKVCYTPNAPTNAVADLTVGLIFSLNRCIHDSNFEIHNSTWVRHFGRRLQSSTIGIIGFGRIGKAVVEILLRNGCTNILINDTDPSKLSALDPRITYADKNRIFTESDIVSLHVPLTNETRNMVSIKELKKMKKNSSIINTSRGGVINEADLLFALNSKIISSAAIDVFEKEPYVGPLSNVKECILTAHMGSMTFDCRSSMEIEATEEVIRYFKNKPLLNEVPKYEYFNQGLIR